MTRLPSFASAGAVPAEKHCTAFGRSNEAPLMSTAEAATYLRVSKSYLDKLRVYGGGPKFLRFGKRILYRKSDLDAWAAERRFGSTSEYVAASQNKYEPRSNHRKEHPLTCYSNAAFPKAS